MPKLVHKRCRERCPEILRRASDLLDLGFGQELWGVAPSGHGHTPVRSLDDPPAGWQFPTKGFLMPLLGLWEFERQPASKEETWEFLNISGVYNGKRHFIFWGAREAYHPRSGAGKAPRASASAQQRSYTRQVPAGRPRAQPETTKMKVLQFSSEVSDAVSSAFPSSL